MLSYFFTPQALKQIKKLPQNIQKKIIKKLNFYCSQTTPLKNADFLIDLRIGGYRFRIGDYRVVFDKLNDSSILILKVGHRKDIYR